MAKKNWKMVVVVKLDNQEYEFDCVITAKELVQKAKNEGQNAVLVFRRKDVLTVDKKKKKKR